MADLTTRRVIEIDAKIATGALQQLKQVNQSISDIEKELQKGAQRVKEFAVAWVSWQGLSLLGRTVADIAREFEELGLVVQKVGMESEAFQKLKYAAELSNIGAETLTKGLGKLNRSLAEIGGNSAAAKALRELGVTANDTADSAFKKIADAYAKMDDGAQKIAFTNDIFGKGMAELIPLLNQGAKALEDAGDEAKRFGIIISDEAIAAGDQFADNLTKIGLISKGVTLQFMQGFVPALAAVTEQFVSGYNAGSKWTEMGKSMADTLINSTEAANRPARD